MLLIVVIFLNDEQSRFSAENYVCIIKITFLNFPR